MKNRKNFSLLLIGLILVSVVLGGCFNKGPSDMQATIVSIFQGDGKLKSLEVTKVSDPNYTAIILIDEKTRIVNQDNTTIDQLTEGQIIEIWLSDNPTIAIYPPQILATHIKVVDSGITQLTEKLDIRGEITELGLLDSVDNLAVIRVEGQVEEDTLNDKAIVTVTKETKIYLKESGDTKEVDVSALEKGNRVEIHFIGEVRESYPLQTSAKDIVILK